MFSKNIKTAFPFHRSRDYTHNKRFGSEGDYSKFYLKFSGNKLMPFQIDMVGSITAVEYIKIISAHDDSVIQNVSIASFPGTFQNYQDHDGNAGVRYFHFGNYVLPETLPDGAYYVEFKFSGLTQVFYSEDFIMRQTW